MLPVLSAQQVRATDVYTIAHEPIVSIDLMERASCACHAWIIDPVNGIVGSGRSFQLFCGTGNNGGDGLAIARMLHQDGFDVKAYSVRFSENPSPDFLINEQRLGEIGLQLHDIGSAADLPSIEPHDVIIDAIFGSGLSRPVTGLCSELIETINTSGAMIIAVDIPSGLFTDPVLPLSSETAGVIQAHHTLTFEVPKLSFLLPEGGNNAGKWHLIRIGLDQEFIGQQATDHFLVTEEDVRSILRVRAKFSHKGTYGHALIVSGSYGKMGACVLASEACLRAGAGLVTAHIPRCGYEILQTSVSEVMVEADTGEEHITESGNISTYSSIGVGPGIGMHPQTSIMLHRLLQQVDQPIVLDADALNILAHNKEWIDLLPSESILTPHPKEFERLAGECSSGLERLERQKQFSVKHGIYVVLKGAHTSISTPEGKVYFNNTGNPGLASAGTGDVLTGVLTGLLAQGYSSFQTCVLGVHLHGLAGDLAVERSSQEAMLASELLHDLGTAFAKCLA